MNRIVVITGASGGLGKELYRLFSADGDIVCSLSRTNPDNTENYFYCDVILEKSVENALSSAVLKFGRIDILICNSGIGIAGALELLPSEKVKEVMDINFYGTYYTIKHALKYMGKGGKIINISSASALFALPFRGVYCASKAAVNMLSFGLAMELAPHGITSCAICPGEINTAFVRNRIQFIGSDDKYSKRVKAISDGFIKKQGSRMPPGFAAEKIFKITNKKNIKPFYIIGAKYKLMYALSKFLPFSLLLKFTGKKYGGDK